MRVLVVGVCLVLIVAGCSAEDGGDQRVASTSTSDASVTTTEEPSTTTTETTTTTNATTTTTRAPPTTTLPTASDEWVLTSGDVLVASGDGILLLRRSGDVWSTSARVTDEPTLCVFPDGGNGIIYQPGVLPDWRTDESFGAILHVAEPGAEPEVVAELWESDLVYEDYEPLRLLTVANVAGDRVVLFLRGIYGDFDGSGLVSYRSTLHEYSLSTGTTADVMPAGVDEVELECIAWAGDQAIEVREAEGNSYIGWSDASGMGIEAPLGEVLYGPQEFDAGGSACVAPETGTSVVLVYQSVYYGCDEDPGFRIGTFDTATWDPIGTVHHISVPGDFEVCGITSLETSGDTAVVSFNGASARVVNLATGAHETLPVSGEASIVP